MSAIANGLPAADGVARFNHLYLEETVAVDTATGTTGFEDPEFIRALDVVFAGLYFAAVDASSAGQPVTRSWAPLFAARSDPRIASIQFALAGMNAHINHDLPLALVSTFEAQALELSRDSPQYRDYVEINDTIAATEARVKQEFLTGMVGVADEVLGHIDDVIAIWSITEARNAAWTNAETLWPSTTTQTSPPLSRTHSTARLDSRVVASSFPRSPKRRHSEWSSLPADRQELACASRR